jgi:WD40 repeat protein
MGRVPDRYAGTPNGVLVKERGRTAEALLPETDEPRRAPILGLATSDDGSRTAVASASELAVHELGGKLRIAGRYTLGKLPERVVESAWRPASAELLLVGSEGRVFVWRPGDGSVTRFRETATIAAPLAVGTSDAGAFVAGCFGGVWIPASQQPEAQVATVSYGPTVFGGAQSVVVCAGGSTVILVDRLGTISALRRTSEEWTTEVLHAPPGPDSAPKYVAASRTGDRIAFATEGGRVVALRCGQGGTEAVRSTDAGSTVIALAVSPDGELVSYATQSRLVIQSFTDGKNTPRVADTGERVTSVEFAPSGDRLVYGTSTGTVGVLERAGPDGLWPLVKLSDRTSVVSVHWSRDSTRVCTVQSSGQLSVVSVSR